MKPRKGQVYKHTRMRGVWIVRSAGSRMITLDCNIPGLPPTRVRPEGWENSGFTLVAPADPWDVEGRQATDA